MNLAVCLKRVPDTTTKLKIGSDGKSIDPQGVEWAISPYDELAIELALRLKEKAGGEVVGVTVDPDGNDVALRKALAIGLDKGVMINGGRKFDVIFFGKQAIDDDAFQVPTMVAQILGLPRVNVCTSFEVDGAKARCKRQIEGGEETIEVALPCVISVQKGVNGIHDKRFPSMKGIMAAKTKPL